ncbi:MAG: hypothetical protein ACJAY2_004003 [Pseudomonadales bacterium]|jgi:hypothetical protein
MGLAKAIAIEQQSRVIDEFYRPQDLIQITPFE